MFRNQQGNICEIHPNCDQNSFKRFSIWNLASELECLTDYLYITIIVLSAITHIYYLRREFCMQFSKNMIFLFGIMDFYFSGLNFPDKITNEQILDFLRVHNEEIFLFYTKNLKSYEKILFEKLKFPQG
ncbi:unnamed protein product [Paramecium octaurelia]|uniref:Uncharacterized protein n=1 Tax=Paramecium octaurelia TaxID=43137 RepID=A0A8S1WUG0_PAROT|nr:unnamed protein product [Paramecium octaurelia]